MTKNVLKFLKLNTYMTNRTKNESQKGSAMFKPSIW